MHAVTTPHGHDEDSSEDEFFLHSVVKYVESLQRDASSSWYSCVNVCNSRIKMKVDTGAEKNTMPMKTWKQIREKPKLNCSSVVLKTLGGGVVDHDGVAEVTYQVGDKRITAELYVTREKRVLILGFEVSVALGLVQPGDNLVTSQTDSQPEHNMEMRIHSVSKYFPATPQKLQALKDASLNDDVQNQIRRYVMHGWPKYKDNAFPQLHAYWGIRDEIHCGDDLLFAGEKLVVPNAMIGEMLSSLHEGHLGMEKCRARAREIMYWPNMCTDIEETVAQCATCATFRRQNNKQPMIPHEIPDRPWAKVDADIFSFKDHDYLVVVDYFSKFPEVEQLTCKTANGVISVLRQIFARHGIPETIICDNMPCLSHVMAGFATEMGFEIVTSSPRYAQSNGLSEKFVGIVKSFMRKAHEEGHDFWMSLLQYRNNPITGAPYSPAQLLMSRQLRNKMPSTSNTLKPAVVNDGKSTLRRRQMRQKRFYDRGTTTCASHRIGDNVRVRLHNTWDRAIVTGVCVTPRSYVVTTEDGGSYRRN